MRVSVLLTLLTVSGAWSSATADDAPLPVNKALWNDPSFVSSFNGSYRPEARIEPSLTSAERGTLVDVQKLMAKGERDKAASTLRTALSTTSTAALRFNLGNVLFELGKTDDAIAEFKKAIELFPSFRRAHRNLALAMIRAEKPDEALAPLIEAVTLGDFDGTTLGMLGYLRLTRGEYASALQAYRQAQLTQPESIEWKSGIAQALAHLDRSVEAIALLDEVIAARPAEPSYLLLQAQMMAVANRTDDAIVNLELARRLMTASAENPDQPTDLAADDLLFLASLYLQIDSDERAAGLLTLAVAEAPAPSLASVVRPLAHLIRSGDWQLADPVVAAVESTYTDQLDKSPDFLRARARLDLQRDQADRAIAALESLVAADPTDGESHLVLAQAVTDTDPDRAVLLLERAAADTDFAYEAWVTLAQLQAGRGYYKRATDAAKKAHAITPSAELTEYLTALRKLAM